MISLEHTSGWSIVAGQDWAIFAPGNPASFAHFAVPLAAAGGNPWMRLPQVRVDKRAHLGGTKALLVQAGILRPLGGGDAPIAGSVADAPVLSGERSGQPFYQGRVALTATSHGRPQALGVSGHYGREKTEPITLDTWGVALDGSVAIGAKLGLAGEIWRGSNLDTFQAGILQGVTQQRGVFTSIDAMGGWVEGSVFVSPAWTIHAGLGVDDPDDDGLGVLVSRAKNQIAWVNLMVAPHPHVTIAFEYNYFDTTFRTSAVTPARKGTGNHVDVAFVLTF